MMLEDILKSKGNRVFAIGPEASVQEAIEELVRRNIGALLVCDRDCTEGEQLLGIITERDVLRLCAVRRGPLDQIRVADVMTRELITATPDDPVESVMGLLTEKRIRHLPVLSAGRLVGVVSIGDVVKAQYNRLAVENQFMKDYIRS
jgi:CBS domain-containing protein